MKPHGQGAPTNRPEISVVCPFYNEAAILERAVESLIRNADATGASYELIIVNDGSTDKSADMAERLAGAHPRMRSIGYAVNQGRGFALRTGIEAARGEYIVTTEIDLSWGEDIIKRLYRGMIENPGLDMLVASPHLPRGGYRNVPRHRRLLSSWGNRLLRLFVADELTMHTGMTRCYRASAIQSLPTFAKGKEFHLEVALKAVMFGWSIAEIPCLLEWKEDKLAKRSGAAKRKSSTKVLPVIRTHLLFLFFANPSSYIMLCGAAIAVLSLALFALGAIRFFMGLVAIFLFLAGGIALLFSANLLIFAVLARQNSATVLECWRLQTQVEALRTFFTRNHKHSLDDN